MKGRTYREHENGEVSTTLRVRGDRRALDAFLDLTPEARADALALGVLCLELGLSRGDDDAVPLADRARIVREIRDGVREVGLLSPRLEQRLRELFV